MNEMLIISTVDTMDLAREIAFAIVQEGKAACVNIVPGIRSIYRWEEKICDDPELLLLIKTSEENFEQVRSRIRQLHTYEIPEVIAIPITSGDPDYLNWLRAQVNARTESDDPIGYSCK
jgi:periplasmic divalent cation tolerance protein